MAVARPTVAARVDGPLARPHSLFGRMMPPPPIPPRQKLRRGRAFWREPVVVKSLIGLLVLVVLAELAILAHHYWTPVAQGERTAARAERRLGQGPLDPRRSRIDMTRIDARARELMNRRDMVGLGIAVVEDGQLAFIKTYGETVAGSGEKVRPLTVFRWASNSKGVAATLVALLDRQRRLSLDDPLAKWAADIKLPKDNQNVATLADALSHRLGIVKNAYDDRLEDNEDPHAIRALFAGLYPMCPPGTCFAYQNIGYDIASEAVSKATGLSYDAAARRYLFGPLGMSGASTTRAALEGSASWARPHDGRRTLQVQEAYYRVPAAGGINSSIIDMGVWMRAQMGGAPQVLPKDVLFTLHVPRVLTPRRGLADYDLIQKQNAYGLGFRQSDYAGHHLIGHRGAVAGYRSLFLFDPAERVGVAMLWNSQSVKPTGMALEVLDQYYRLPPRDWMRLERP